VIASGKNVNLLVLDTEVYSNTGGQMSKSTSRAAVAKFAAAGKPMRKKDLSLMALVYGNVYVARVAMGANDAQTVRAILEAESYDGPSIIIAYSHCIEHGIDMSLGARNQKIAVETGYWPLFRFDPRQITQGKNPFKLDSKAPKGSVTEFTSLENRFNILKKTHPDRAEFLMKLAQDDVVQRWNMYEQLSKEYEPQKAGDGSGEAPKPSPAMN
jgi:pyruvate-ferredoxin/flavodoxin oxidoreductase